MTVAPIVRTVEVKAPPARAFDLFMTRMEAWWPKGMTIGKKPFVAIVAEPRAGGRWYERDADGMECQWGHVIAWEPPSRVVFAWQLNSQFAFDSDFVTEVEVGFAPRNGGGTIVRLEHRNIERYGADAEKIAGMIGEGWPRIIAAFAAYVDASA